MGSSSSKARGSDGYSYDHSYASRDKDESRPSFNFSQYINRTRWDSPSDSDDFPRDRDTDSYISETNDYQREDCQRYQQHSHRTTYQSFDPPSYNQELSSRPPQPPSMAALLWQVSTDGPMLDIAFTPGGGHVAAVVKTRGPLGEEREVRIWEVQTGLPVRVNEHSTQGNWTGLYGGSEQGRSLDQSRAGGFYNNFSPGGGPHGWSSGNYGVGSCGASGTTSGNQLNHHVSGTFIMNPLWGEAFLRPDNRYLQRKLDLIDLRSGDLRFFEAPIKLCLPIVASPNPGFIPGFDCILVGVDYHLKGVIHVLCTSENGARLEKQWNAGRDEITHLAFHPSGGTVYSLSKDGYCRWTSIVAGSGDGIHINSRYPPDMIQVGWSQVRDPASGPGYITGEHVVSIWGSDVAFWYLDTGYGEEPSLQVYNLNETLGRRVLPLCISHDGCYLACGSHNGFDIIEILTGTAVRENMGKGLYDIEKAAFSLDGQKIVVSTAGKTTHLFAMLDLYSLSPVLPTQ